VFCYSNPQKLLPTFFGKQVYQHVK